MSYHNFDISALLYHWLTCQVQQILLSKTVCSNEVCLMFNNFLSKKLMNQWVRAKRQKNTHLLLCMWLWEQNELVMNWLWKNVVYIGKDECKWLAYSGLKHILISILFYSAFAVNKNTLCNGDAEKKSGYFFPSTHRSHWFN